MPRVALKPTVTELREPAKSTTFGSAVSVADAIERLARNLLKGRTELRMSTVAMKSSTENQLDLTGQDETSGVHRVTSRFEPEVLSDAFGQRPIETTVRFIEGEGGCSVLEVETSDRSGFVRGLSHALIQESVQIVQAEVRRVTGGVQDRFVITGRDGLPLSPEKRLALQVAVLSAVDMAS